MVSPVFKGGELIGVFACTAHVIAVNSCGFGVHGKSVCDEGIQIPIKTQPSAAN